MRRRTLLKGAGATGATVAAGGIGLVALSGGATAADTQLEGTDPGAVTTDDGEIEYVAYGGRVRFEWDGLDSDATWGRIVSESRVYNNGSWSSWREHIDSRGELGASWGGGNDYTQDTGTDGVFEFKFGSPHGQDDYAIAGSSGDTIDTNNQYSTSLFEADTDGGQNETTVEIRKTCEVWDGEPGNGGDKLIADDDTAEFTVTVNNREATATTGGEVEGAVGADES